ncbi:MAG: acyl-CoA carboxylase subunit beta [Acidimicrobiia bacterium]
MNFADESGSEDGVLERNSKKAAGGKSGLRYSQQLLDELEKRRHKALELGGSSNVERQHSQGKLTARERIDLLCDPGSFMEFGMLANHMDPQLAAAGKDAPADGVICGLGKLEGRPVAVCAYDFTVMAGSMGNVGEQKVARLRELSLRQKIPFIWLLDSAGARIQQGVGSTFAAAGALFKEQVVMSGVVPMVAAVMGPCAAGTAYIPALADVVFMVANTGSMALGGSHLVRAAVGEEISDYEMGGPQIHCRISGCADLELPDDVSCLSAIRDYLSYFPSCNLEDPPVAPCDDPVDRLCDELLSIVPSDPKEVYDVYDVIEVIVDYGSYFPIKPDFAQNIVTVLARMGGRPVGIVASQPSVMGGALDNDAADKAARFVWLCDAFSIPLVFLQDVPGFLVGSEVEKQGIIRHGAKMLYAVSEATVPKVTVVMRKAYGAGYFVMNGRAYEADFIVAWPTAEISVMGPEGAVNIIFRKEIAAAPPEEQDKIREQKIEWVRKSIDPYVAAGHAHVDDVIRPEETRKVIIKALELSVRKTLDRPWKKHGVIPV